jgi:hypothetical protein
MASGSYVGDKGRDGVREVSGIQMKRSNEEEGGSSNAPNSELVFDEDTDKEIESFLKQELIREDVFQDDVLQTQHANEQTCSTADDNRAILNRHPDDLSESKTAKTNNPNVVHTEAKVLAAEAKPLPSTKTTSISPMWDNYILAVRGIPPREAGVSWIQICVVYMSSSNLSPNHIWW